MYNLILANLAKVNPAAPATATSTGGGASGGFLAAGNYFLAYTNCDAFGETNLGASEIATAIAVASGNIPQITLPALPTGVDSRNIYITLPGGASGTEKLYATGVTGTTFNLSFAALVDAPNATTPTVNTSGADTHYGKTIGFANNDASIARSIEEDSSYMRGASAEIRDIYTRFHRNEAAHLMWKTAFSEAQVLKNANLGTWGYAANSIVGNLGLVHNLP